MVNIISPPLKPSIQKKSLDSIVERESNLKHNNASPYFALRDIEDFSKINELRKRYLSESECDKNKVKSPVISLRYKKYNSKSQPSHIDPLTGALVFEVPSHELPPHVLGLYHIPTHTIYIANDLSSKTQNFVYHHEVGHALGIHDDSKADDYAAQKVGYDLAA